MKISVVQEADGKQKGQWRWKLEADSGKLLGTASQTHATREACLKEVKAVQTAFPSTKIVDKPAAAIAKAPPKPAAPAAAPRR